MLENDIADEMATVGYVLIDRGVYLASWSTSDVEHLIYLARDSRKYLGAQFGMRNPSAEVFGYRSLCTYGHENFTRGAFNPKLACNMSFDFGRIDKYKRTIWPRVYLPSMDKGSLAELIIGIVRAHIFPHVREILALTNFLGVLASTAEPFPWFAVNRAVRTAQLVAVARQLGIGHDDIRRMVAPYDNQIAIDLHKREQPKDSVDTYVRQLVYDWDRQRP